MLKEFLLLPLKNKFLEIFFFNLRYLNFRKMFLCNFSRTFYMSGKHETIFLMYITYLYLFSFFQINQHFGLFKDKY